MDKTPPNNLEAEAALIGCLILEPIYIDDIAQHLKAEHFYSPACSIVYQTMLRLQEKEAVIDKISIVDRLRKDGKLELIGGPTFLSGLMEVIPTEPSIDYYAKLIEEAALHRRIIDAARGIARIGYGTSDSQETAIADCLKLVEEAYQDAGSRHVGRMERITSSVQNAFTGQKNRQVLSPFPRLNEKIGGFYPGEMYIWAGGPKAGKTSMELTIAHSIARNSGLVIIFAVEMGQAAMTEKEIAMESGVTVMEQRSGNLTRAQGDAIIEAQSRLMDLPIEIVHWDVRSIPNMRRMVRKLTRTEQVKAIFIDHVGLTDEVMRESRHEGKVERLERAYGACLKMGQEFNCSVHVIQHINREGSKSNRPTEHDIRGGGNPNGLAHGTLLVHRPDPGNLNDQGHLGELIISSSRNGDPGVIPMFYDGARGIWTQQTPFISSPVPEEWSA